MAEKVLGWIPERAQSLIREHTFAGGSLIHLESKICRPSWKD